MSFLDILEDYEKEEKEKFEWSSVSNNYEDIDCLNCGRHRIEKCENGKHWCEKCNLVMEDNEYFIPEWRI